MEAPASLRRWNVDEFDKMIEFGVLAPRGYELMDGVVYNTQGFVRRWSVHDLDRMAEAGVITPAERAELIAGSVFRPRALQPLHSYVRARLVEVLFEATRDDRSVIVNPVGYLLLGNDTLVAPEMFMMTREALDDLDTWPGPAEVSLVCEIIDPIYAVLIEMKRPVYARFEIPELWVVDPARGIVKVHATPVDGEYLEVHEFRRGETWQSAALRGARIAVTNVVGRER